MRPGQVRLPVINPTKLKDEPEAVGKIVADGAFYFEGGSFRVQQKNGNGYWYVTAFVNGKLRKRYIGKELTLTTDALRAYLGKCYDQPGSTLPTTSIRSKRVGKVERKKTRPPVDDSLVAELRAKIRELEAENAALAEELKIANQEADEFEIEKIYTDTQAMKTVAFLRHYAKTFKEIYQAFFTELIDKARLKQSQKLNAISQLSKLHSVFDLYILGYVNKFWLYFLESGVELDFYKPEALEAFAKRYSPLPEGDEIDMEVVNFNKRYHTELFKENFIPIVRGYHKVRQARLERLPEYAASMSKC